MAKQKKVFNRRFCMEGPRITPLSSSQCNRYVKIALVDISENNLEVPSCFEEGFSCFDDSKLPRYSNYLES